MSKRSYKQNCTLAQTGDFLCERWTLLIFRELLIQPCRFKELNQWLKGAGTNLLSDRLKSLESDGFIKKQDANDSRSAYELTSLGASLEPVIFSMIRWGFDHFTRQSDYHHFHHWDLLAMKALYRPEKYSRDITIQFDSKELTAWVKLERDQLRFGLGKSAEADYHLPITIAEWQKEIERGALASDMKRVVDCFC